MGYKSISVKVPTDYNDELLRKKISKELNIKSFTFQTENKSLDARNKSAIHWLLAIGVFSPELKGGESPLREQLHIPSVGREQEVLVVGNGPVGFFAHWCCKRPASMW